MNKFPAKPVISAWGFEISLETECVVAALDEAILAATQKFKT